MPANSPRHINIATYGCPSQPIEYYQVLREYLEGTTGYTIDLLYDTERLGPSLERGDSSRIDFAFVSSRYGHDLLSADTKTAPYSVVPVGAMTQHPDDAQQTVTGYYSVVVVRSDKSSTNLKSFSDLRGFKLAYSDQRSLSGVSALLNKLRQAGENATFFGGLHRCGSHLACLQSLVDKEMDVAVVDSIALCTYEQRHPRLADKISRLWTWGPHPPHPLVVRDGLDADVRQKVVLALLQLRPGGSDTTRQILDKLLPFGVMGFGAPDPEIGGEAAAMLADCSKLSIDIAYY